MGQSSCGSQAFFAMKQRQSEHCEPWRYWQERQWPMRSSWSGSSTVLNPEATKRARGGGEGERGLGGSPVGDLPNDSCLLVRQDRRSLLRLAQSSFGPRVRSSWLWLQFRCVGYRSPALAVAAGREPAGAGVEVRGAGQGQASLGAAVHSSPFWGDGLAVSSAVEGRWTMIPVPSGK
jgi:hypothetical protein